MNRKELDKDIYIMSEKLKESIKKEKWSDANERIGFLHGLIAFKDSKFIQDADRKEQFAEWNLEGSIRDNDFGRASYWEKYIQGLQSAKNMTV